jgi:UPF0042 nucleotide-binding protein
VNEFVVIAGMSGAGRSEAANVLEDLGWFVIDNMPPALMPKVGELAGAPGSSIQHVGLVVGTRAYLGEVMPAIRELRETGSRVRIVFLDAADEVLIRRYEDKRRRHPLSEPESEGGVAQAIERERVALEPVKAEADVVVDTSDLNVHQLRDRIVDLFGRDVPSAGMQTTVMSFGYKHGLPLDTDLVLDCRFLPNPHWVDELRPLTGADQAVQKYVKRFPETKEFMARLEALLDLLLPAYVKEGKSYLTIAFGCTGGRHRSVVMAEEVARILRRRGYDPNVLHRDVEK